MLMRRLTARYRLVLLRLPVIIGLVGLLAWSGGALWFDFPLANLRPLVALAWVGICGLLSVRVRPFARCVAWLVGLWLIVLVWWLTLQPSHERDWQPDVAELAWAEIDGDLVMLHNVRHTQYRTASDYTPHWKTRQVRLSQITGMDLFINYWGSPWMAHPILSFQFADGPPICFSIETRKEKGEVYSAIGGLYRQYELIFIVADERDIIRLRTNFRAGEDTFLYRLKVSPAKARERFLEYLDSINHLRDIPRWYHAIATNCTTAIRSQLSATDRLPLDWRLLINGKGDEMVYEFGMIETDGLGFDALREQAHINDIATKTPDHETFSQRIRAGRAGLDHSIAPSLKASKNP